jgi:hypothetical protein
MLFNILISIKLQNIKTKKFFVLGKSRTGFPIRASMGFFSAPFARRNPP